MANEHVINNNLIISGSVTSSIGFAGDGSGLTNITALTEWDGSRNGDAEITGSFIVSGSGANVDFTNAEAGVSGSFSGSFEGDGSGLTGLSLDGSTIQNGEFSGSFSGSFEGDGSGLTGLNNFPFTGDAVITGSLTVSGSNVDLTDSTGVSGSFSGSFVGDGSGLTNIPASEWDGSRDGDASITGSLVVSGSGITVELKGDTTLDENILISNTGDSTSIGIGSGSLQETTQSRNTIAIGIQAGDLLVSGSYNIYIGNEAGKAATKTQGDTAVGYRALNLSTGIDTGDAENNSCNTAIGYAALTNNTEGEKGTAVGANALASNTTGLCNTALGHEAGCNITTGDRNVTIGDVAGLCVTTENNNTVIGNCSGYRLESSDNVSLGKDALRGTGDITGGSNTALGANAGECLTGASTGNVYIGKSAGPATGTTESNKLYINNSSGTPLIKGDFSTSEVEFAGGVTGSFSGSFSGDGSSLTGITSDPSDTYKIYQIGDVANSIVPVKGSNKSSAAFSTVLGGTQNTASAACSVIVGGESNCVIGAYSSVIGGLTNCVTGNYAAAGGSGSIASGDYSFAYGGPETNPAGTLGTTSAVGSWSVAFGFATCASGSDSLAVGHYSQTAGHGSVAIGWKAYAGIIGASDEIYKGNTAIGCCVFASGSSSTVFGALNYAIGNCSNVLGGFNNKACATQSTIVGGNGNRIDANASTSFIGAGSGNLISSSAVCSGIVAGHSNCILEDDSFIGGGHGNIVATSGNGQGWATIGGGQLNCTGCGGAAVVGGAQNDALGCLSFNGGGFCNINNACYGVIVGGCKNNISSLVCRASILGGSQNTVSGSYSSVLGGDNNCVTGECSSILGGVSNTLTHTKSFIIGSNLTSTQDCTTFVNNLSAALAVSASGNITGNTGSFNRLEVDNLTFDGSSISAPGGSPVVIDDDVYVYGDLNLQSNNLTDVDTITANTGSFNGGLTSNGFVVLSQVSESLNFEDDTAAAAGGVPLGGLYRSGNFIVIRLT